MAVALPTGPKLVATDLDGTLVRSNDTVSTYTHQVMTRVAATGVPIVAATGRGPRLLNITREHLPTASYLVLAGGAKVVDLTHREPITLFERRLPGPVAAGIVDQLERLAGPMTVMVEALDHPCAPLWGEADPDWPWPERVVLMPREQALAGDVVKLMARPHRLPPGSQAPPNGTETDAVLAIARRTIPPETASLTQSWSGVVEICPPGVDKATGLAVVAEALGVDPAEVLVFGDAPNDVPMFGWAGWGKVAVANAHPSVRALAEDITLSNDQDGVAMWLDLLLPR